MKLERIEAKIELPEGVNADIKTREITLKSGKGEVSRKWFNKKVNVELKDKNLVVYALDATKREKTEIYTLEAHLINIIKGLTDGITYKLRICSSHFPMTVTVSVKDVAVKNFLGEKIPRVAKIIEGVTVKMEGTELTVTGIDKEHVAQTAANIEQVCRITDKDRRKFMDGIYIISKDGKAI
jgi:large subunit ribosomal protein L6